MKRKLSTLFILMISLCMCVVLASCGGNEEGNNISTQGSNEEPDVDNSAINSGTSDSTTSSGTNDSATSSGTNDSATGSSTIGSTNDNTQPSESTNSSTTIDSSNTDNSSNDENIKPDTPHTHTYSEWNITKAPTCTEAGINEKKCSCGDTVIETINATGHNEEIITGKASTCTETGLTEGKKCSVCGEILLMQEETELAPHTEAIVEGKEATCTETGLTEGKKCSVCGEILLMQEETELAPHTEAIVEGKEATCTETGLTEGKKCSVCGEILLTQVEIKVKGHNYDEWEIIAEPTCTQKGSYQKKCFCGDVLIEEIKEKGHNFIDGYCDVCNSRQPSQGLKYKLSNDGTCYTVLGIGTCTDTDIYIPSTYEGLPVTTISSLAFKGCRDLTSIEIEKGVTSIGFSAFMSCDSLTHVTIPSSVTSIGGSAFSQCENMICITFEEGSKLTSIGDYALYACVRLTEIEIPNGVTTIGKGAFSWCFDLVSVKIPSSVKSIDSEAFSSCYDLTSITIPSSVTNMGNSVFANCGGITIYCELKAKPNSWYNGWNSYQPVVFDCANNNVADDGYIYTIIDGIRYSIRDNIAKVAHQGANIEGAIVIPESITYNGETFPVTSISEYAFNSCDNITSLKIPNSIINVGYYAVSGCSCITIYCEADSKPERWDANWNGFYAPVVWNCNSEDVANDGYVYVVINGIKYGIKDGNATVALQPQNIKEAIIPKKVTYKGIAYPVTDIHSSAFSSSYLTNITFEEDSLITKIGNSAFSSCYSLTSITIPSSVTSIGRYVFSGCINLTSVEIPSGITSIGDSMFSDCKSIKTITLHNGITSIDNHAFLNCFDLESIEIPSSVISIGEYAFGSCFNLKSVKIHNGVTSIGDKAFNDCEKLTSAIIPNSVTNIGISIFNGCKNITIYCEAKSEPDGWNNSWNYSKHPVVWGYTEE